MQEPSHLSLQPHAICGSRVPSTSYVRSRVIREPGHFKQCFIRTGSIRRLDVAGEANMHISIHRHTLQSTHHPSSGGIVRKISFGMVSTRGTLQLICVYTYIHTSYSRIHTYFSSIGIIPARHICTQGTDGNDIDIHALAVSITYIVLTRERGIDGVNRLKYVEYTSPFSGS